MTRQEVIKELEYAKIKLREANVFPSMDTAIDMAIEALTHECESCIWDICNYNRVDWDAEPIYGEWLHEELIPNTVEGHVHGECSVCHAVRIVDNYCPNCGAKMDGGK